MLKFNPEQVTIILMMFDRIPDLIFPSQSLITPLESTIKWNHSRSLHSGNLPDEFVVYNPKFSSDRERAFLIARNKGMKKP